MTLLLSGERPLAASATFNPFRAVTAWFRKARAGRARRLALHNLLELDASRLDDLGIDRGDLFDAMNAAPSRSFRVLAERRARRASDWLNP